MTLEVVCTIRRDLHQRAEDEMRLSAIGVPEVWTGMRSCMGRRWAGGGGSRTLTRTKYQPHMHPLRSENSFHTLSLSLTGSTTRSVLIAEERRSIEYLRALRGNRQHDAE